MSNVSIRELRNKGGDVIDRAAGGERITITRAGQPVAELHAVTRRGPSPEVLLARWRELPAIDPARVRAEIDTLLDPSL